MGRTAMAIGISRGKLRAVSGETGRGQVAVRRAVCAEVPPGIDRDDAEAVGAWVGEQLDAAGFPAGRVTVALAREQLGIKRMTVPTIDERELPDITAHAMGRELPFDAAEAVIDFVPISRDDHGSTVLAVAVPREVLEYTHRLVRAAGRTVERISLRAMGVAALLSGGVEDPRTPRLAVDVSHDAVEFCVVAGGTVRFSRTALLSNVEVEKMPQALVTETRRTWMSYRIVDDAEDVGAASVVGTDSATARRIGEALDVPCAVIDDHPRVRCRAKAPMDELWPLAGLLLEPLLGRPLIDLAQPRRAPDLGARRRQAALAAAGLVVVLGAAAIMLAKTRLDRLEQTVQSLTAKADDALPDRLRHKRDRLKLAHLEHWQTVHADWLEHLATVGVLSPPPGDVVLEQWTGVLEFRGVTYEGDTGWAAPRQVRMSLQGEARDRLTADAFRAKLVDTELYATSSVGADAEGGGRLPHTFAYTLRSDEMVPERPQALADREPVEPEPATGGGGAAVALPSGEQSQ